MNKRVLFFLALMIISVCGHVTAQVTTAFQSGKLVRIWETPPVFSIPESACYDPGSGNIYVSNVAGNPTEKDGHGFISRLNPDGSLKDLQWVTGLNAPKGMGISAGQLYVTDIDRVAQIDLASGRIMHYFEFPEARFLNDIDVDKNGAVYISDMMSTRIYRIYSDRAEIWLDDSTLTGPNGLYVEGDDLLIGCKKIVRVNLNDKKITEWLTGTGGIDGLEGAGNGRYLFSDWKGSVYLVGSDLGIEKLIDTSPAGINAADIEYIPSGNLLLVPTFHDNRVVAYELK